MIGIAEFATIGQNPRRVDQRILTLATFNSLSSSPLTDGIVLIKREAQRIDAAMAGGAVGVLRVNRQSLSNGNLIALGRNGLDRIHVRRRCRRRLVEDRFAKPHATMHRTMTGA